MGQLCHLLDSTIHLFYILTAFLSTCYYIRKGNADFFQLFIFSSISLDPMKLEPLFKERQIEKDASYAVTHQWNPIFKRIQRNLFTKQKRLTENKFMAPKGKMQGGGINQELQLQRHAAKCRTESQQGPTVQPREHYSRFCDNFCEERI